jgi:hypothetical protein
VRRAILSPSALAAAALMVALAIAGPAAADEPLIADDTLKVRSTGDLAIDAGLLLTVPAALPTGLSTGIGGGFTRGETLAWGARASWSTTTESTLAWTVTQWDLRLRAVVALQHAVGRATLALRLGLGATMVHESRLRNDGVRARLTGSDIETSALDLLPAGDLEGVIALHVMGPWILVLSGGPSAAVLAGDLHSGWTAQMGIAWQP